MQTLPVFNRGKKRHKKWKWNKVNASWKATVSWNNYKSQLWLYIIHLADHFVQSYFLYFLFGGSLNKHWHCGGTANRQLHAVCVRRNMSYVKKKTTLSVQRKSKFVSKWQNQKNRWHRRKQKKWLTNQTFKSCWVNLSLNVDWTVTLGRKDGKS